MKTVYDIKKDIEQEAEDNYKNNIHIIELEIKNRFNKGELDLGLCFNVRLLQELKDYGYTVEQYEKVILDSNGREALSNNFYKIKWNPNV